MKMPRVKANSKTTYGKKTAAKKQQSRTQQKTTKLSTDVYDTNGKKQGSLNLPKEFFGQKVNKSLLKQALHIYFENQSKHTASVKTRGQKRGGGAKPWRQKGTGRARAGSNRSPLWVGGGTTHGPKFRNVQLNLSKKMKHQALISALSSKANSQSIKIISNLENIEPKTKIITNLINKLELEGSNLFIVSEKNLNLKLATRNLQKTFVDTSINLNALEI